jgi:hypothetical protein
MEDYEIEERKTFLKREYEKTIGKEFTASFSSPSDNYGLLFWATVRLLFCIAISLLITSLGKWAFQLDITQSLIAFSVILVSLCITAGALAIFNEFYLLRHVAFFYVKNESIKDLEKIKSEKLK